MSKVFANIGLSLDGYMAPEGMIIENWDRPEYKNWGAKWGALMAGSSNSSTSARTSSSVQEERPVRSTICSVTPWSVAVPTSWASECLTQASVVGQKKLRFTPLCTCSPTRSANHGSGQAGRRSFFSTMGQRVPLRRRESLRAVVTFASRAERM
jgi:hypothetical protein